MDIRKSLAALCVLLTLAVAASAQIRAVEQFVKDNDNLEKYFIYQSSLRMLNTTGNEGFNKLIKEVRKINVYISEDSKKDPGAGYNKMIKGLAQEDFETLVSVKNGDMNLNLMGRENGDKAYYVLAATEGSSFGVLEMDGKLDLRYLQSLEDLNFDKLMEIVGQDGKTDEKQKDQ